MAKPDRFVTATHPTQGTLWAAIDPNAHHLTGQVADRRFSAFLAPFMTHAEAEAALHAAGAVVVKPTVTSETQRNSRHKAKRAVHG
jgi:hypothetical protein